MNAKAIKAKGRDAENAVVDYLRLRGIPAERRRLTGIEDCGDIAGWDGVVIEVKNEKRICLATYVAELEKESLNSGKRLGPVRAAFVVVKRKGTADPGKWYAVTPLEHMVNLVRGGEQ